MKYLLVLLLIPTLVFADTKSATMTVSVVVLPKPTPPKVVITTEQTPQGTKILVRTLSY